ncbi:MAG: PAS domain S-box protein, partial [Acidobacteriota bacterium]|nr:PAS domain S-box protein [Acidobacteriota bacterium]
MSVITGATIAMSSVGVVFIVGYVWLGASLLAWTVASGILLGLLCLALLRLTRRATLFGNIATAVLAAVLLVVALRSGGLESTGFSWLLLLPVIAAFGVGLRAAWVWLGVVWISALCFWVFDASAMVVIPVEHATLNSLFNRLGVSLSLAVVTTVFIKALRRIEDRLSRANLLLEDEVRSRRQMEAELRESQERSRDLVENSPMMLYTHDLEGNILSANRALVEFLGCRHESDLVGKSGITLLAPEVRSE